jgi:hypothetical protein
MTADQATQATEFIAHPALRARAIHRLTSGAAFICPSCGNIADTLAGCTPCDEAYWEDQAAKHDAVQADRDWYADRLNFKSAVDEYEFRNFCGEGVN